MNIKGSQGGPVLEGSTLLIPDYKENLMKKECFFDEDCKGELKGFTVNYNPLIDRHVSIIPDSRYPDWYLCEAHQKKALLREERK